MAEIKYNIVGDDNQSVDSDEWPQYVKQRPEQTRRSIWWLFTLLLLISGLGNVFLLYKLKSQSNIGPVCRSEYGE